MAVYRLLTELEQRPDADIELAGTNDPAAWNADKLTRLASTELSNTETVTRILDVLCQEPGKQYDMQDLVKALSMEYHTLRGNLAAFTRHLKKHYDSPVWPMQVEWRGDEALYSLTPEMAALWRSVRV
jgi:DNA-binding transcriptional ArsR family regulator